MAFTTTMPIEEVVQDLFNVRSMKENSFVKSTGTID